jgi:DNA-binding transcriptional MerR regulator
VIPIGELSRRTGVHIETIRYYEREGVLPKARRTEGGRRYYGDVDVRRVGFIRHARDLGFDIAAVRVLLALQETPGANCEEVSVLARAQLVAVESRITKLRALSDDLNRMIDACAGGCVADCRIIDALAAAHVA